MNRKRYLLSSLLSTVLTLQPVYAAAPALQRICAAGGVRGRVQATSPGEAVGHVIASGKPLFLNDHVTTDKAGKLQVMLLDETVFTLGPNADMVLDDFVYDPTTQAGRVTASITKGVFRFVTGKIARNNPSSMKVKLPVGTIGIRGTIVAGIVTAGMSAAMLAGPGAGNDANAKTGAFDLSNGAGTTRVNVSGEGSMITGGGSPTPAGPLPASVMGEINAGLSSAPTGADADDGGSGGGSASEESGESTAAGNESSNESGGAAKVTEALGGTSTQAAQDNTRTAAGVADGISTWDQLRQLLTGGTGFWFSSHVAFTCVGCTSTAPEAALQLYYDFANKCIGGPTGVTGPSGQTGSFIHLHGVNNAANSDTVQSSIALINYSSLGGNASLLLNPYLGAVTGGVGGESFNGTTLTLKNIGGIVAGQAVADMTFNSPSNGKNATGTIVAPR